MAIVRATSALGLLLALIAPAMSAEPSAAVPPVAAVVPHQVKAPWGAVRQDEYYWLRDDSRKDPRVLAYLKAESDYAETKLAPLKKLRDTLYKEFVARTKEDAATLPVHERGYYYYEGYRDGEDYPVIVRRRGSPNGPSEILLDEPKMAKGSGYFEIGDYEVSQDNSLVAFSEDRVGRRQYVLRVRRIGSGRDLPDEVPNVDSNIVWADDNRTIFYVENDPVTLLSKRVKAHVLGTPAADDRVLYEEKDDSYYMALTRTASNKYICLFLSSTTSTEQRCTSAAQPGPLVALAPRERGFLYNADHVLDHWVIRTNWKAPNYRLMTVGDRDAAAGRTKWVDLVRHDPAVFIESFQPFDSFTAVEERSGGNKRLRLLAADGRSSLVASDEPAYAMTIDSNPDPQRQWLRYVYNSLTTPPTTYEVNSRTGERRLLYRVPAPGYDPKNYVTERVWAPARDGTKIPVSVVYRKGFRKDGKAALFQYGYGAYGYSSDPYWSPTIVSLLDRGMVHAIAHVRGGQEMGRLWYDQGHLLRKKNSFTDFIDVTRFLVANGYAARGRVGAMGASAGGLLMGAVANMAPEDYRVIVAQMPFVDVVTTMLDRTIPLTTNEYDEWGNPERRRFYDYMLSYSPYDNVAARAYPAMFVGAGFWDSQVQYYEPAKWVARLRARKTDSNPLLFRISMEAGHGGTSGRFRQQRDTAAYYAFMLQQLGLAE